MQLKEFVTIRIGKNGVTDSAIAEIKKNLDKKNNVKVKLLKNFTETSDKRKAVRDLVLSVKREGLYHKAVGNTLLLEFEKK